MPMRAWYDISGMEIAQRQDETGLRESMGLLNGMIEREVERGIDSRNILLAGFSQGGAIVLGGGIRCTRPLGGIVALSTYLPMAERTDAEKSAANRATPIFQAHGMLDPTIPHALGEMSRTYLSQRGYNVEWHAYQMAHQVSMEEIVDLRRWIGARLK
jgi:phospholipase/carboxylesterase